MIVVHHSPQCKAEVKYFKHAAVAEQSFVDKSLNETTVTIEPEAEETCTVVKTIKAGYKLIFYNIDKTIKPRFMTQDSMTTILHYVQMQ